MKERRRRRRKIKMERREDEEREKKDTNHKDGVNTINLRLAFCHRMITHVPHDGNETVNRQLG